MEDKISLPPLAMGEEPIELIDVRNLDFNDPEAAYTILERYHAVPDLKLTLERNLANDPIGAARHVSLEGFNPGKEADGVKVLVMAAAKTQAAENSLKPSEIQKKLFDGIKENLLGAAGWFAKDKKAVKIGTSLAIFSMALSACNNVSIPDTVKTLFPSTPLVTEIVSSQNPSETPTEEASVTPTQTETALPTATATQTETPTPTEVIRFSELMPKTLEECKKNNYIRWDHLEEDMLTLSQKEEENLPTKEEVGKYIPWGMGRIRESSDPLYAVTPMTSMLEMTAPIISCSYLDTGEEGGGLVVFGFPFYSSFDDKVHVFHGAVDWGRYDEIQKFLYDDASKRKSINYDTIVSRNYTKYYVNYIGSFQLAEEWEPTKKLFENLWKVWTPGETFNIGFALNPTRATPEIMQKLKTNIQSLLKIYFE